MLIKKYLNKNKLLMILKMNLLNYDLYEILKQKRKFKKKQKELTIKIMIYFQKLYPLNFSFCFFY
jgi:hypothetical protein